MIDARNIKWSCCDSEEWIRDTRRRSWGLNLIDRDFVCLNCHNEVRMCFRLCSKVHLNFQFRWIIVNYFTRISQSWPNVLIIRRLDNIKESACMAQASVVNAKCSPKIITSLIRNIFVWSKVQILRFYQPVSSSLKIICTLDSKWWWSKFKEAVY